MIKLILLSNFMFLLSIAAAGQNVIITGPAKPEVKQPLPADFVREKFDPARDPAADLAKAVAAATPSGKRIILDIGGEWCSWCVYMDKFFFLNPELAKLRDDNYVWIKINYSEENENKAFLAPFPQPQGFPHLYVLDGSGKLIHSQDTSPLEAGKGYDLAKFTEFLKTRVPKPAKIADLPAKP